MAGPRWEVRASVAVVGRDQMQHDVLHLVAEFRKLAGMIAACMKYIQQGAELVAVVA